MMKKDVLIEGSTGLELKFSKCFRASSSDHLEWIEFVEKKCGKPVAEFIGSTSGILQAKIGEIPLSKLDWKIDDDQKIYRVPDGVNIASYNHLNEMQNICKVSHISVTNDKACIEVSTSRNRTVVISDDSLLPVFDHHSGEMKSETPSLDQWIPYFKQDSLIGKDYDFDVGKFYGMLAADGWQQDNSIGYAKNSEECRKEFESLAQSVFRIPFNVRTYSDEADSRKFSDSVKIHLNGKEFARKVLSPIHPDFYLQEGLRPALFKKIPDEILLNGSHRCHLGLFSGLIDGDCSVGWNKHRKNDRFFLRFNTSSPYLVASISRLLRKLGLRHSVTETPARGASKTSWTVCPSVIDLPDILSEVRVVEQQRKQAIAEFLAKTTGICNDTLDYVPLTHALQEKIIRALRKEPELKRIAKRHKGYMNRQAAIRIISKISGFSDDNEWNRFVARANSTGIHWEMIDSIRPVPPRDVFSLVVPDSELYCIANGLVM
ncbi:MAG: LAGLIDADG family homing endonuclease [Zavarzinella sp.]